MTKREVFGTVLAMLGATFDRKVTPGMLEGYWTVLEHLSEDEIKAATKRALAECKFMPAPSEMLALARPARDPNLAAIQAWQEVRKAIDVHDYLVASIDFGPLVNAVIRNLGGWDTLCRATLPELDNPGWLRKRFEEVYAALSTANPQALHGSPLAGALPPKWQDPKHVVIAIEGEPPLPRLEPAGASEAKASITEYIEALAKKKASGE